MNWDYDISKAPRGKYIEQARTINGKEQLAKVFKPERVILATKCGKVTISRYIPEEKRWEMLGKNEEPEAWKEWPKHPRHGELK